jgi:hypothetical protein
LKIQECLNTFRRSPFGPQQETENRQTDRQVGLAIIRLLLAGLSPRHLEFDASAVHLGLLLKKFAGTAFSPSKPYFGSPLPVPFHKCSTLIHSSKTDAVQSLQFRASLNSALQNFINTYFNQNNNKH